MFRFTIRELLILTVTAGLALGPALLADDKPKSAEIEVGRPIAEVKMILREREIEWNTGGWAETAGNPDIAEVDFDLNEEMVARVYYSKSGNVVTGIRLVVSPRGQGRVARTDFPARRIVLEDDGSYSVQFLREP